jgi:DNA-binding LytR/AlgR family response regulator
MSIRCLVVDDEPLARKLLMAHISTVPEMEVAGECSTAMEASNFLRVRPVDLIFLDIQMPQVNGLQLLATLRNPPAVILTTAFRDFAPEAFDLDVVDYLLKPISLERFLKSVNKFFDHKHSISSRSDTDSSPSFIYVKSNRKQMKVAVDEIYYIESLDNYVKIFLKETVLVTRENISMLGEKLLPPLFVRIHRSFIINSKMVKAISGEGVEVNGKELPFGRAFKLSALAHLQAAL